MHLILTGATGLVGSAVLDAMIKAKDVTKISVLSRRPVALAEDAQSPKVRVITHSDFGTYSDEVLDQLRGAQACVWALGTSQTKVSGDEYVRITRDYALAAASSFSSSLGGSNGSGSGSADADSSRPFRFVYVSGEGATQTPGRFSATFARVKGETERALADMAAASGGALLAVDSVRPAFVDAARHGGIQKYVPDPGFLYRASIAVLGPVVRAAAPGMHSPTPMLGRFLTELALGAKDDAVLRESGAFRLGPSWVVPNVAIRKAMGL